LLKEVGKVDGRAMLEVRGRLGMTGVGAVPLSVPLFGRSHAVYTHYQPFSSTISMRGGHTLFVSTWNFTLNTVFVILLTKSAVPIPLLLLKLKPQPRSGFFGSPIVPAAALMTVLRWARSCTAGVAMAAGTRMMPVRSMVVRRRRALLWTENMLG
jgi:hypothetical protein